MLDKFKLNNIKFALFPKSKIKSLESGQSAGSSLSNISKTPSDFFSSKISKINATTEEVVGESFVFKTERPRVDYGRYVYWCDPFESINNKGKF